MPEKFIAEGELTKEALTTAWQESVSYLAAKSGSSTAAESGVDFDTFLRLNVRLDLLMDDIEASRNDQLPSTVSPLLNSQIFGLIFCCLCVRTTTKKWRKTEKAERKTWRPSTGPSSSA